MNYVKVFPENEGEVVVADSWREVGDPLDCGQISVEMAVPFNAPPHNLSKQEIEAERKLAKRMKKNDKEFNKLLKLSESFHPKAPPPRLFQIRGFEARQSFSPPSDCIGCEDFRFETISVQFSKDKKLTTRLVGNLDGVVKIIESLDLEGLNTFMDKFAKARK